MADPITIGVSALATVASLFGGHKDKGPILQRIEREKELVAKRQRGFEQGKVSQKVLDSAKRRLASYEQVARDRGLLAGPGAPAPAPPDEVIEEPELEEEQEEELPWEEDEGEFTEEDRQQEEYDEYLSDLEAESGMWDQPWFEQADPVNDPTEQIGDPERRAVERELRKQDVAPYAVEYYRSEFVDDRPRVPDRVPTRMPGRVGSAGAMVEGIVNIIRLGRALWELQTEELPQPKGPTTRRKGRVKLEPELEPITVKKARKPAVRLDETTRRALETRTRTSPALEPELEEIRVTKARRAPPATRPPRTSSPTRTRALVDLRTLGLLYDLVRDKPKSRTVIRERIITAPGVPELPPTLPELSTPPTRAPELPPLQERARVEQSLTQDSIARTRTREKKCKCEKPKKKKRTVCYEGFFREREKSEKRTRWNKVDCITGKDI